MFPGSLQLHTILFHSTSPPSIPTREEQASIGQTKSFADRCKVCTECKSDSHHDLQTIPERITDSPTESFGH